MVPLRRAYVVALLVVKKKRTSGSSRTPEPRRRLACENQPAQTGSASVGSGMGRVARATRPHGRL